MAYYRTTPRTPAQRKGTGIMFILFGLILLAVGLSAFVSLSSLKSRCTVYEIGMVVSVKSRSVRSKRGRHTEYQAYFGFDDTSPMHGTIVISPWKRKHFKYGDHVKVFYDPVDTSAYYIDGAAPDSGIPGIILGIIITAIGYLIFKNAAIESAAAEENDSY